MGWVTSLDSELSDSESGEFSDDVDGEESDEDF